MQDRKFSDKMGDWVRSLLSCFERPDEEENKPALRISGPTNFRREDISIPGLDPEQQRYIREKAVSDATRIWEHPQPLRSSPSGRFVDKPGSASNNSTEATLPSYEEFTTPKSVATTSKGSTPGSHPSRLERVMAHGRKLSSSLTKPLGYQSVSREGSSPYEMRALVDQKKMHVVKPGKLSGESYSVAGSDEDQEYGRLVVRF